MSLFSIDCKELTPCAVPVHHTGQIQSYGSTTSNKTTTLSAIATPSLLNPSQSRKSSTATAIENADDESTGNADFCGGVRSDREMESKELCRGQHELETDREEKVTKFVDEGRAGHKSDCSNQGDDVGETKITPAPTSVTRVFKKCASNGSLALYVGTRTVTIDGTHLEPLKGIIVLDKESLQQTVSDNFRIWGQITLTFRYGREDEEVLGLRFCNEAILALKQLWPPLPRDPEDVFSIEDEQLTSLQSVLLDRVKISANSPSIHSVPFTLCAGPVGIGAFPPPPSVLLAPAKLYKGSPIGTLYDLRIYASERPEERPPRRNTIRLALRAVQTPPPQVTLNLQGSIESRPTILSRGKIRLICDLNSNAVHYGEPLELKLSVQNNSRSSIRRVLVSLIQQVDVCMFTSGKFKNIVGYVEDNILLVPGASYQKRYNLTAQRGPARQWLALEEAFGREPVLAPSTVTEGLEPLVDLGPPQKGSNNNRNVFAIIVSYYVKVKLVLGGLALCQSLKMPFVLLPPLISNDPDPYPGLVPTHSPVVNVSGLNVHPETVNTTPIRGATSDSRVDENHSPSKTKTSESGACGESESSGVSKCVASDVIFDNSDNKRTSVGESSAKSRLESCFKATERESRERTSSSLYSPSSTGLGLQATVQHHQPQIHHNHQAASPTTTPSVSPVRMPKVPSVEHLF